MATSSEVTTGAESIHLVGDDAQIKAMISGEGFNFISQLFSIDDSTRKICEMLDRSVRRP